MCTALCCSASSSRLLGSLHFCMSSFGFALHFFVMSSLQQMFNEFLKSIFKKRAISSMALFFFSSPAWKWRYCENQKPSLLYAWLSSKEEEKGMWMKVKEAHTRICHFSTKFVVCPQWTRAGIQRPALIGLILTDAPFRVQLKNRQEWC